MSSSAKFSHLSRSPGWDLVRCSRIANAVASWPASTIARSSSAKRLGSRSSTQRPKLESPDDLWWHRLRLQRFQQTPRDQGRRAAPPRDLEKQVQRTRCAMRLRLYPAVVPVIPSTLPGRVHISTKYPQVSASAFEIPNESDQLSFGVLFCQGLAEAPAVRSIPGMRAKATSPRAWRATRRTSAQEAGGSVVRHGPSGTALHAAGVAPAEMRLRNLHEERPVPRLLLPTAASRTYAPSR